jgi:hypothetical protein
VDEEAARASVGGRPMSGMPIDGAAHATIRRGSTPPSPRAGHNQAEAAHWAQLNLYPLVRRLMEQHFVLGVLDESTAHPDFPTQRPDRSFIFLLGYLVQCNRYSLRHAKKTILGLVEQRRLGGFWKDVFDAGRDAAEDQQALARLVPAVQRGNPIAVAELRRAQMRSITCFGLALGGGAATWSGFAAWGAAPLYGAGAAFLVVNARRMSPA